MAFSLVVVRCPRLHPPPNSIQSGCVAGSDYNVFDGKCLFYCNMGYQKIKDQMRESVGQTERVQAKHFIVKVTNDTSESRLKANH